MSCRTPGCNGKKRERARYCARCGWPLARGVVEGRPDRVLLRSGVGDTLTLQVSNLGQGPLRWELAPPEAGLRLESVPGWIDPGESSLVLIALDPEHLSDENIELNFFFFDRHGENGFDFRPESLESCRRTERVVLPVSRKQFGPLTINHRALLFAPGHRSSDFFLNNEGEAEVDCVITCPPEYRLKAAGHDPSTDLSLRVSPGFKLTVTVEQRQAAPGTLTVRPTGLPLTEIELLHLDLSPGRPPKERYVVAVDFGTSKSAVAVFDQHKKGASPQLVRWTSAGHREEQPFLPSVVAWNRPEHPTRFGWEVSFSEVDSPAARVIREMKLHLNEGDRVVEESIRFFLRRLFEETARQFGDQVMQEGKIIFTLPVLSCEEEQDRQRQRTIEFALQAGRSYDLTPDRILTFLEPECAAIDFLSHIQEEVRAGRRTRIPEALDWLCVLDMGGGTTDITFAQLQLEDDGTPSFSSFHSFGYPGYAGLRVDQEMYDWCLERWLESNRYRTRVRSIRSIKESPSFKLKGEDQELSHREALVNIRLLKEKIFEQSPPVSVLWDIFSNPANNLNLEPGKLRSRLDQMSTLMFQHGAPTSERTLESLRHLFDQLSLPPAQVRYLCLTGGTTLIPYFKEQLCRLVLTSQRTEVLQTQDSVRLNVVRGAARRLSARIQGQLRYAIILRARSSESEATLGAGALPGKQVELKLWLQTEQIEVLEVLARIDGIEKLLFQREIPSHDHLEGLFLEARLEYATGGHLKLEAYWLDEDHTQVFPKTFAATIPVVHGG